MAGVRLLSLFLLLTAVLRAEDWPQFRGPTGQGLSSETNLPLEWSENNRVLWKTPVPGSGWSSPAVAGDRVWLTAATDKDGRSLRVLAFDRATGKEVVNVEVFKMSGTPQIISVKNTRASPTPVVDGYRVYVHFGAEGTAALTTNGEVVWKTRFRYDSQHGSGGSPAIYGNLLILSCDGPLDAFVVALDKATGKVKWKTNRRFPFDQAYSTPLVIHVGDKDQVVSVGAHRAAAYDPLTGKEIWRVNYQGGFSNVPRPVYGHGLVYVATGYNEPSLLAVRVDGTGDVTKTHVAWTLTRSAPFTPSPLLVGDELYTVNDGGIATCLDAKTGAVHWRERVGGAHSASPVYADGRIYFQTEEGITLVIAASKTFQRLAASKLDGDTLASLAISDGSFYVRTNTHLYRIGDEPQRR